MTHYQKNYQNRWASAYDYWIEQGAPPSAARDLAHEQIAFEDARADYELNGSKGTNDSQF